MGYGGNAGAINELPAPYRDQSLECAEYDRLYSAILRDAIGKMRIAKHLDPLLAHELIEDHLQTKGVKGGHVAVIFLNERGINAAGLYAFGRHGGACLYQSLDDFVKQSADRRVLAVFVVIRHEGTHQRRGCHTAEHTRRFDEQHAHSLACRGDGGAYTGGACADHDDVIVSEYRYRAIQRDGFHI